MILKNAFFSLNGVDLSDHVQEISLELGREGQDDTTMGHNTRTMESGLKTWSLSVTFKQSFVAGKVDATLFGIYNTGNVVAIILRPEKGAKSATNPEFTGDVVLESYSPLGQSVGDFHTAPVQLAAAGNLTRTTS